MGVSHLDRPTRFAPPAAEPLSLPRVPPKTTFGGRHSPEGRRITAFMDEIAPLLACGRGADEAPLGVALCVGLPSGTDLLTHHDLDNFLEPLATALASPRLSFAAATKGHGAVSTLRIGPVEPSTAEPHAWNWARARCQSLSTPGRRALGGQVAAQAEPVPWGPVELDLALQVGTRREWVRAWKPVLDSLVAILGRRPGASEFDIEDGRIVALALHREIDPRLGDAIAVDIRWRLLEALPGGPPLTYEVLGQPPDRNPTPIPAADPVPTSPPRTRSGPHTFEPILTLERLRELRQATGGFIIITDNARPPRIHSAGCRNLEERFFVAKVIENGGRNGAYFFTRNADAARARWARLSEHVCV
jgi:hypothetical protein